MEKKSVSVEEQETTFNLYPKITGTSCDIYSCEPAMIKRIKKYAERYPQELKIEKEDAYGIFASCPRDWFPFKPPRRLTSPMSEERKKAAAERMAAVRAAKSE